MACLGLLRECDICDELRPIVKCKHDDCKKEKKKYCQECGEWRHRKKSHKITLTAMNTNLMINGNGTSSSSVIKSHSAPIAHSALLEESHETKNEFRKLSLYTTAQYELAISAFTSDSANIAKIECEGLCEDTNGNRRTYSPENVFICKHDCCSNDKKILCQSCGEYKHKYKSHRFDADTNYVISVQVLLEPDKMQFDSGKLNRAQMLRGIDAVEKILWRSRWLGAMPANGLHIAIDACSKGVIDACSHGSTIAGPALVASASGASIAAAAATAVEWALIWRQWYKERITGREAIILGGTALVANGVSAGSFFGFMAAGAALGTPLGPIGTVVGSIIGAIICGIVTRKGANCIADKYFKKKHETQTKLQKEAIQYFFNDENYDIDDISKFNESILRRTYHRLSLINHPDRPDGDEIEWLKLSSYYGILTAICDEQNYSIDTESEGKGCTLTLAQINLLIKEHPDFSKLLQKTNDGKNGYSFTNTNVDTISSESRKTSTSTISVEYSHLGTDCQDQAIQ